MLTLFATYNYQHEVHLVYYAQAQKVRQKRYHIQSAKIELRSVLKPTPSFLQRHPTAFASVSRND